MGGQAGGGSGGGQGSEDPGVAGQVLRGAPGLNLETGVNILFLSLLACKRLFDK